MRQPSFSVAHVPTRPLSLTYPHPRPTHTQIHHAHAPKTGMAVKNALSHEAALMVPLLRHEKRVITMREEASRDLLSDMLPQHIVEHLKELRTPHIPSTTTAALSRPHVPSTTAGSISLSRTFPQPPNRHRCTRFAS